MKGAIAKVLRSVSADSSALAALGPIQEISFSFDTAEPMRVLVEMTTMSNDDALMIADVLKGAESLTRLTLKETRPELSMLMSDLVIEADTGLVRVAASIPVSDIDAVRNLLGAEWMAGLVNPRSGPAGSPSP